MIGLLDVTAVFDCVDCSILLRHMTNKYGVTGTVLYYIVTQRPNTVKSVTNGVVQHAVN